VRPRTVGRGLNTITARALPAARQWVQTADVAHRDPEDVTRLLRERTAHRRAAEVHERAAIVDDRRASIVNRQEPERASELRTSAAEHRVAAVEERRIAGELNL
jgi:hypothetical protein